MPEPARKPVARMESRSEVITFKVTPTEEAEVVTAAFAEFGPGGVSRYVRDCLFIGHSMKQAQARLKRTSV